MQYHHPLSPPPFNPLPHYHNSGHCSIEANSGSAMEEEDNYSSNNDPRRRGSKRRKEKAPALDRISRLPNPLILHILSFLPTKYAARTSLLSKKWQCLWTCLPILDFFINDSIKVTHSKKKRFVSFINQSLILNQCPKMENFRVELGYKKSYATIVDVWLRFATRRNVEELELNFYNVCYTNEDSSTDEDGDNDDHDDHYNSTNCYALPMNIFRYNSSLVTLKLKNCRIDHHGSINWKTLKVLSLSKMSLSNDLILEIFFGSPLLEFLELLNCCDFDILRIKSERLTKLVINDYGGIDSASVTVLRISAPNIQSLGISGYLNTKNISLTNMKSLIDAELHFFLNGYSDFNEHRKHTKILVELLKNLHHVKHLTMGRQCLQVLPLLEEKVLPCPLSCCVYLRLDTCLCKPELAGMTKLLALTPLLETLVIDASCIRLSVSDHFGENFWSSQKSLFALALQNLKTVKIVNFRSMNSEIELICFLLKNASSLAKMIIHAPNKKVSLENSLEFAERLLSIRRCSRDAVVVFS